MIDEPTSASEGTPSACPFVAFEDDRDHRSDAPDYRHRCFAAPEPEPRAFPHQERYCLGSEFGMCPVFLDWARQEAATVKAASAAAATAAQMAAEADAMDDDEAPAFLARSRNATPVEVPPLPSKRNADAAAGAGLWSYESETKRTPAPTAPPPPSSLKTPTVAMARRGPSHPGWENPPRLESFPRLRGRDDRRANQPLLIVALCVALIFVALVTFPILTSGHGSGAASPGASGSGGAGSPTPAATITPTPGNTFIVYYVKSGDYLTKIASKYNVRYCELLAANPDVVPNHIEVGDPINIPVPGTLKCATPAPSVTPAPKAS